MESKWLDTNFANFSIFRVLKKLIGRCNNNEDLVVSYSLRFQTSISCLGLRNSFPSLMGNTVEENSSQIVLLTWGKGWDSLHFVKSYTN